MSASGLTSRQRPLDSTVKAKVLDLLFERARTDSSTVAISRKSGELWDRGQVHNFLAQARWMRGASEGSSTPLTRREMEITRLIAEGMSDTEIATRLFLSPRTVESHVTNMINKLGLNSRVQLVAGWLPSPSQR